MPYIYETYKNVRYKRKEGKRTREKIDSPFLEVFCKKGDQWLYVKTIDETVKFKVLSYSKDNFTTTIYFDNKSDTYGYLIVGGEYDDNGWLSDGSGTELRLQ